MKIKCSVILCLFMCEFAFISASDYLKCIYLSRALPCVNSRYQTIDGTCNNLEDKNFGKSYWNYDRLVPPTYSDGVHAYPKQEDGSPYTSARDVSNLLFPSDETANLKFSLALMQVSQIVAHDMALADGTQPGILKKYGTPSCCNMHKLSNDYSEAKCPADIVLPPNDTDYSESGYECFSFRRTTTTAKYLCLLKPYDEQINLVTSYLDMSFVYGSTIYIANVLRAYSGGKLKVEIRNGQEWPLDQPIVKAVCTRAKSGKDHCYLMGDSRLNQTPQLSCLHVIFMRHHNRIAEGLSKVNPHWTDDILFQEARRINIALYQSFVYNEILPDLLGPDLMVKYELTNPNPNKCHDDYDKSVDASVLQEFATGAYRYFHTLIAGIINTYDSKQNVLERLDLSDWIDRGNSNELNETVNCDHLLRGLAFQPHAKADNKFTKKIKCQFAKDDKTGLGVDLISFDIARARDHGMGSYVQVRKACNLSGPTTWDDMEDIMSKKNINKLKKLYVNITSVEYLTAAHLERQMPNSLVGPTHGCIIGKQFKRTRSGDRYFYNNCQEHSMTPEQITAINKVPMAKVFCENANINTIQFTVTRLLSDTNPLMKCSEIPSLDLYLWKDESLPVKGTFSVHNIIESLYNFFGYIKGFFGIS